MNYGEVKTILNSRGYNLEYIQTGGNLCILSFMKDNIEITLHFDDYDLELEDGIEIDYENDEWLRYIEVETLIIPSKYITYKDPELIYLTKDKISFISKALDIIEDPHIAINYAVDYYEQSKIFSDKIQTSMMNLDYPFEIEHNKFDCMLENGIYYSWGMEFKIHLFFITFIFDNLTFDHQIYVSKFGEFQDVYKVSEIDSKTFKKYTPYIEDSLETVKYMNEHNYRTTW